MSNFGIVCEFNPLHNGHIRLFSAAREREAERIVCVMSGNAVQRGELAIFDKYARAEAALKSGADLVLELPFPWSAASAEYFSSAAVLVLSHFCDNIIFGSECGDIDRLSSAAERASSEEFRERFVARTESGERAAQVYFEMLSEGSEGGFSSNDLLGIEYIRAIKKLGISMVPHTVCREGAGYNERTLTDGELPSATALRSVWQEGNFEDSRRFMPQAAYEVFQKAYFEGAMTDIYQLSRALLMYFRLHTPEQISGTAGMELGIANRICSLANESASLEELFEKLSTKRYTDAKLRRAMLFALCSVKSELLSALPEYTTLLAAKQRGRELLASVRKRDGIKVVTKPADAPSNSAQYDADRRLDALFTLAKMQPRQSGEFMKKGAFIE